MKFRLVLLSRAISDIEGIIDYLAKRSPQGVAAWCDRWEKTLGDLRERPLNFSLCPEASKIDAEIRQVLFKTRRGRTYRALFTVVEETVYILHVRGPGQDFVPVHELRLS
jgi:plasmid stabilization system protein ParE